MKGSQLKDICGNWGWRTHTGQLKTFAARSFNFSVPVKDIYLYPLKKKRGRPPKTNSQNLLLRLGDHESSALAFLHDINVPFTNNLAEQDIRVTKVRLKIFGCFRTHSKELGTFL